MHTLTPLLMGYVYSFGLVFLRLGAVFMLLPGFSGAYVPARVRLLLALAVTVVATPVVKASLPPLPADPAVLAVLMASEMLIGIVFGLVTRLMLAALDTAGSVISLQLGLSAATTFDPALASQGTLIGSLLTNTGLVLLFATDMDHMLISGAVDTYTVFAPGAPVPWGDFAELFSHTVARSFMVGVQLGAPFIAIGLVFFLALGLLARMMPQLQVFFLALPVQILVGMVLLSLTVSSAMLLWLKCFQDATTTFLKAG